MQKQQERYDDDEVEHQNDLSTICLSFNSYSSSSSGNNTNKISEIAIKVSDEFRANNKQNCSNSGFVDDEFEANYDDDEFEFALIDVEDDDDDDDTDLDFTLVTGDDNQFKFHHQMFPVFNREILSTNDDGDRKAIQTFESSSSEVPILQVSLKNLFLDDDRDRDIPSSSSSEIDDLEGVKPETYCIWMPKQSPQPLAERCKKSNSTGSKLTKRWSLRTLLGRSNSDGKPPFVYLTKKSSPESSKSKQDHDKNSGNNAVKSPRNVVLGKKLVSSTSSAHEVFYVRNRAIKEGNKRRSYLPYRQEIFGVFASNINRLSMTKPFPPF